MKTTTRLVLGTIFFVVPLTLLAWTVWPTLYRYDRTNLDGRVVLVRVHRFTGRAQRLTRQGWEGCGSSESGDSDPEVRYVLPDGTVMPRGLTPVYPGDD